MSKSDIPLPESAFNALGTCVLEDLAPAFVRAIFLAGSPAQSEAEIGNVTAIATDDAVQADLEAAWIDLAEGKGSSAG